MCRLNVLFFSVLRQKVGVGQLTLEFEIAPTGGQLLDDLATRYASVAEYRTIVRLAVNQEYVDGTGRARRWR